MLYLCCTKLGVTLVNPLFIGYYRAIYDKPMLAISPLSIRLKIFYCQVSNLNLGRVLVNILIS